jgi:hypothetical protein
MGDLTRIEFTEALDADPRGTLRAIEDRLLAAQGRRRGVVSLPSPLVLGWLLDAGPAGMANVALCERTGWSEAQMAVMLKHAAQLGLCEWSVSRAERAAYRLTEFGEAWILARRAVAAEREAKAIAALDVIDEVVDAEATEIRELEAGD